jgi:NitT/TauT family transport system substrate-binding protein
LPAFAAQDAGLFKQLNLEAELPYFAGGQVDAALAAGQCDFVLGAGGVGPLLQGVDVVAIAVTGARPTGEVWGRPSLRSLQDLKGKAIATSGAGSLTWRLARYYLQLNNLVPDEDVAVLGTGSTEATLGAIMSGSETVAAALLTPPDTFRAQKQGLTLLFKAPPDVQMINTGVVTTRRYLNARRDVAIGVVKGITDAMVRLKDDETFFGEEIARFTAQKPDPAILRQEWQTAQALYTLPPRINREGALTSLRLYSAEAKNQDLEALATNWLDMSIVDALFPMAH